jgi:hypothetical protein
MEQTSSSPNLFKHAARMGAIGGGIGIALTVLIYIADIRLMADWKVGIFFLLFYLGYVIYAGIQFRKESGGYLPYGKAFQHGYITLAVGGVISTLFSILLFHVIDPSIPETLTQASIEKTEEMMAGFGMPEDKIEEEIEKQDIPGRFTVVGQLTQLGWSLLINAVVAAITAIFVRKNQPETL